MKKTLIALVAAVTLSACASTAEYPNSTDAFTQDEAGAMFFGAAVVALCATAGVCVF